jgi:hypothetical protein
MIYSLNSNFVRVEWLLAELWLLNLYFLFKFEVVQPYIIRPERNSSYNCNSSRYSQIPNIKSIYQRTSRKSLDNLKFEQKYKSFDIFDLIFGMWLYLDELQFKFEFRSGRMTFGWVMALELVFFVQIWSCPDFSKFNGHNSAKSYSTRTKFELKL